MGRLWTPGGDRDVPREQPSSRRAAPTTPPGDDLEDGPEGEPVDEELAARMRELQDQLAATPVEAVVANHCYGLFELAALHLGQRPPQIEQARLAIDALGALVEGLKGRLGEHEAQLGEGLTQLRLAFVQIRAAEQAGNGGAPD